MSPERRFPPDPPDEVEGQPSDQIEPQLDYIRRDIDAATTELDAVIEAARERARLWSGPPVES